MKVITKVKPFLFETNLILSISSEWITVFEKIPTFVVSIDDNRKLHIISMEAIKK